jgi:hypothetical protein
MQPGSGTGRLRRVARAAGRSLPLFGFLALVSAAYVFWISAGHLTNWPTWTAFYNAQAQGFQLGHLYLPETPSAALQHLKDPLDPANMRLWRWDHSYYRGHFFLYWGLVPALLLTVVKVVFRIQAVVGDEVLVFVFFVGRLVAGTLLLRAMARRVAPRPPLWAVGLALAVFAFAHPTPYTLARGGVYEAAIGAGACFMLAGLGLAFRGIFVASPRAADRWLLSASACFGLAGGSRASLLPAVALLGVFTAFARFRIDGGGLRRLLRVGLAACGPAVLLTLAHFVLNRLRYDAWTEFGARYQLGLSILVGARFIVPDLFAYLFCPPTHSCTFPFLFGRWNTTRPLSPTWISWPADHHTAEPTIGLLVVGLFAWLALGGLLPTVRGRRSRQPAASEEPSETDGGWRWRWVWGALLLYTIACALPLFLLSATTMRYEADFASGLFLLATLGGWRLLSAPASRAGRAATGSLYVALAIFTIVASALLGFGGYFDQFKRHNPDLNRRLEATFSVCGGPVIRRR